MKTCRPEELHGIQLHEFEGMSASNDEKLYICYIYQQVFIHCTPLDRGVLLYLF